MSRRRSLAVRAAGAFLVADGILLIVLSLWPAGRGTGTAVPPSGSATALRALAGATVLLCGIFASMAGVYIRNVEEAVLALSRSLAEPGGTKEPPVWSDLVAVARAVARTLASSQSEARRAVRDVHRLQEMRIAELTDAHADLATHHRYTKRMLQSQRSDDVFETLIEGIRDGFGFRGAVLGLSDGAGDLVFRGEGALDGRPSVRVPSWDEGSLIARTAWAENTVLLASIREHPHRFEDRLVLGEGPAFLVPLRRKLATRCSEAKGCGMRECPAFANDAVACWAVTGPGGTAASRLEKMRECARCPMFGISGLLAVRGRRDARPFTPETMRSVTTLVDEAALALEIVELYENARRMSITDGLTGLVNHKEFFNCLRRELERARRYRHTVSLLMIDVDDFKKYNDSHGHLAGDRALKKVAALLQSCARATDIVARYGGEEFGIILPESTPGGALMLAERIKTEIARCDFDPDGSGGVRLTVSVGICSVEGGAISEDRMVGVADEAAYLAKNSGKNRVVVKAHA
ncbi:MAG: GGDEF domain-containing protein [Gemmatimonadota bacterium]